MRILFFYQRVSNNYSACFLRSILCKFFGLTMALPLLLRKKNGTLCAINCLTKSFFLNDHRGRGGFMEALVRFVTITVFNFFILRYSYLDNYSIFLQYSYINYMDNLIKSVFL